MAHTVPFSTRTWMWITHIDIHTHDDALYERTEALSSQFSYTDTHTLSLTLVNVLSGRDP